MVRNKKTVLARVPRKIDNYLRMKMPNVESSARWSLVYDLSAVKFDQWLGQPMKNEKKKKR